jgi:cytochrome P450
VLIENPRNFTVREAVVELQEFTGDGLVTIDGELHRQQRRLVQPAFHKQRVTSYAEVMVHYTLEMLAHWRPGQCIEMAQAMQELTIRIVAKCLFNIDLASQLTDLGACFSTIIENPPRFHEYALHLRLNLPFTTYGRRQRSKARIDSVIYDLIAQRRTEGCDKGDVLSMLLLSRDQENMLNDIQIRDHIMTFFAAGHETTSNLMTWTFYLLAQHPPVLEKLQAELRTVLAGRAPTLEDCAHLHYTEWVLNEAMRLYPPIWTLGRRAIEAFELDGYHFPAGSFFVLSQWIIHRHPDLWEDAERFRPERWHPERTQQILPGSYFPFGIGPRICIGMPFAQLEAKLLLATILQQYAPCLLPGYRPVPHAWITLRPKYGLPMMLEKI